MNKLFILLFCVLAGCIQNRKTAEATNIEHIKFGSGGGVIGQMQEFTLHRDGAVVGSDRDTIKTVDREKTYALFRRAESLTEYKFQQPKNLYSFLVIRTKNTENRITWGTSSDVKQEAAELYQELKQLSNK